MQESTTREKVLKKIRKALISKTNSPFPQADFDSRLYQANDESPEIVFANELMKAGGHFIFCNDKFDFIEQILSLGEEKKWNSFSCPDKKLKIFLEECEFPFTSESTEFQKTDVVLTFCECLVARTGSVLISSRQAHGRRLPAIAQTHLVVAYVDQFVNDIKDALLLMKGRYANRLPSLMTFVTGPSKTADIELIQVTGAHGPAEIFVFLINQGEEI